LTEAGTSAATAASAPDGAAAEVLAELELVAAALLVLLLLLLLLPHPATAIALSAAMIATTRFLRVNI
jgi:hypothetical protein